MAARDFADICTQSLRATWYNYYICTVELCIFYIAQFDVHACISNIPELLQIHLLYPLI